MLIMPVEGIPQREEIVTFTKHWASYNPGESASFTADEVSILAAEGVIDLPPTDPPVNVDAPHVSQAADVLTCTMGNWDGEPTGYSYQWQIDGAAAGTDADTYTAAVDDVGKSATCIVTATNAAGSTAAPPADAVVIT